ncbi:MAG: hypothetical protein ACKVP0_10600 [Pirellulaceae bacterium]
MICEVCYTSAQRGLFPGASGYCTVKATPDLPPRLRELLESLGNYRPLFPPGDARAGQNPVGVSFLTAQVGGSRWSILSRLSPAPLDYSKRSNFFAHHLGFVSHEHSEIDPAWLASHPDLLKNRWDGRVEELPLQTSLPRGREISRVCDRWQAATGDAGWAGVVAQKLQDREVVYIAFTVGTQIMPLMAEVFSLIRPETRAATTFSTYFCGLPAGLDCQLRAVVEGSPEHQAAKRSSAVVIELGNSGLVQKVSPLVIRARTGKAEELVAEVARQSVGVAAAASDSRDYSLADPLVESSRSPLQIAAAGPVRARVAVSSLPVDEPATGHSGFQWGTGLLGLAIGLVLGALPIVPFWLGSIQERDVLKTQLEDATKNQNAFSSDVNRKAVEVAGLASKEKSLSSSLEQRDAALTKARSTINSQSDQITSLNGQVNNLKTAFDTKQSEAEILAGQLKAAIAARDAAVVEQDIAKASAKEFAAKLESKRPVPASVEGRLRFPLLPDPRDPKVDWKTLAKVKFSVKTLTLEDSPAGITLKKPDDKLPNWDLLAKESETVGSFKTVGTSPNLEFRFQWNDKTTLGKQELQDLWVQLSLAKVKAVNGDKELTIDLSEELPLAPMPAKTPTSD